MSGDYQHQKRTAVYKQEVVIVAVLISISACVLALAAKFVVNRSRVCAAVGAGESKQGDPERSDEIRATFGHLWM